MSLEKFKGVIPAFITPFDKEVIIQSNVQNK